MPTEENLHIALAMTGASGVQYGLRLLDVLLASGHRVSLMLSKPARVVIAMETDLGLPSGGREIQAFFETRLGSKPGQLRLYGEKQWTSPLASGSGAPDAMVVCPCTTGSLAAIATGQSRTLIERAADVVLKERRKLVMVVRETPFSDIHLENMLRLSRMGVVIMPANPGFYHRPASVEDIVDFMVSRILEQLNIAHDLLPAWGGEY